MRFKVKNLPAEEVCKCDMLGVAASRSSVDNAGLHKKILKYKYMDAILTYPDTRRPIGYITERVWVQAPGLCHLVQVWAGGIWEGRSVIYMLDVTASFSKYY